MSFCPNGPTDSQRLLPNTSYTVNLSSADTETGAIRILSYSPGPAYASFSGTAGVTDIRLNSTAPEVFKIPSGATQFTVNWTTASSNFYDFSVTIGQLV